MGMYEIETRTCEAKNFFAGDFQTLTESEKLFRWRLPDADRKRDGRR